MLTKYIFCGVLAVTVIACTDKPTGPGDVTASAVAVPLQASAPVLQPEKNAIYVKAKNIDEALARAEALKAAYPKESEVAFQKCQAGSGNQEILQLIDCMETALRVPPEPSESASGSSISSVNPIGQLSASETFRACDEGCKLLSHGKQKVYADCVSACTK